MLPRLPLLAVAVAAFISSPGCGTLPDYSLRVDEPQKDVLRVRVTLPEPLPDKTYRRLAHHELDRVLALDRRYSTPLYEVRFEFFVPTATNNAVKKSASYTWRLLPPSSSTPVPPADLAVR